MIDLFNNKSVSLTRDNQIPQFPLVAMSPELSLGGISPHLPLATSTSPSQTPLSDMTGPFEGLKRELTDLEQFCEGKSPQSDEAKAEIRELGWQLQAWEKSLQKGVSSLLPAALKDYGKNLFSDPDAEQRLLILQDWARKTQDALPQLKKRWESLTERFGVQDHDYFPQIEKHTAKIKYETDIARGGLQHLTSKEKNALFASLPLPKPSLIGRCFHALWSDRTKNLVFNGFSLMQLTAQFSNALRDSVGAPICSNDPFEDQCFSLKMLEQEVASLMETLPSCPENDLAAYGNKHKNIVKQAYLADALELPGIKVPLPKGVSTDQVTRFLQKHAPEVFEAWEALSALDLHSEEAKRQLEIIDKGIEKAFSNTEILNDELVQWLEQIDGYLMVRSTGAEDSRKSANAGGNLSVSYVKPNPEEFCRALGSVVRSYFGINSLQNRINAGLNPFEEELSLAVTAQELIGEADGEIPISLVAFSNEPLYIGNEKFRVTRLSATYGHGEGVVGNQGIESDTVLVLHSKAQPDQLYILYDNQEKPTRLAPVEGPDGITLQKVPNPEHLVRRPALSKDQIARLFHWGVLTESYFEDDATDMEIVIKGDTIYPVQARPINRGSLLPTYIDLKKIAESEQSPIEQTLNAEVLVPGKASALELQRDEILVADTLEEAEKRFAKDQHKLVVVHKSEPANSHPVVNFSSLGIPCLYLPQKQALQGNAFAVCMQSGDLHIWNTAKGKVEDFTSEGFVVHPAKIADSLSITETLPAISGIMQVPEDVRELALSLRTAVSKEEALKSLKLLKQHDWLKGFSNEARSFGRIGIELDEKIEKAFSEIEASSGRLETLIRIKHLETLLFAPATSGLAQYSVVTMQENFAAAKVLSDYQNKLSQPAQFADILLAGTRCPAPEVFEKWQDFLLGLEKQAVPASDIAQLKHVIHTLEKAGALSFFMTFFFDRESPTLQNVLEAFPQKEEAKISQLLEHKQKIQDLNKRIEDFGSPSHFENAFRQLEKLDGRLVQELYREASPITRSIAIEIMHDLIDTYDTAIKTMKRPGIPIEEKPALFKKMLLPFSHVLDSWADSLTPNVFFQQNEKLDWIGEYFAQATPNLADLQPSTEFSVARAAFGSRARFAIPQTMEDVFTFLHQSHLAVNGYLAQKLLPEEVLQKSLPEKLEKDLVSLDQLTKFSTTRTDIRVDENTISIQYNDTFRWHSGSLIYIFDKQFNQVNQEMRGVGEIESAASMETDRNKSSRLTGRERQF
ncbi:MAG: hypothetical protein K1000chlam2_01497 [Chlamydiae bacterium]|nr:hypothetical protein [Chlamydiota bacterium]